jgi:hypothetical protein
MAGESRIEILRARAFAVLSYLPHMIYFALSLVLAAAIIGEIGVAYSFNTNEGWSAYWAAAAVGGGELYPGPESLKLDNYPPLWFYATGALGRLTGDNIEAGRILSGAALLLNAAGIALIVHNITARRGAAWLAGAAFLGIFGLLYGNYAGVNDGQVAANAVMTGAMLIFVRRIALLDAGIAWLVPLMLLGGLIKPNVLAVPASVALFLLLFRPAAFAVFALVSVCGVVIASAACSALCGPGFLPSVLMPRPYDLATGWAQTKDQLWQYNLLLLVVPFLASQRGPKPTFVLIYAIVSLIQGWALSGGADVDANVFFDFTGAIAIGLGLLAAHVATVIRDDPNGYRSAGAIVAWLSIAMIPAAAALNAGIEQAAIVFGAVTRNPQADDIAYLRATPGRVICDDLALCYWAGKDFEIDPNNLKTLIWIEPDLEKTLLARIESCAYALIQLDTGWEDDEGIPQSITSAIKEHYGETRKTATSVYRAPARCRS